MPKQKKDSPKNDSSWVQDLRKKLADYTKTSAPAPNKEVPTVFSERSKSLSGGGPVAIFGETQAVSE